MAEEFAEFINKMNKEPIEKQLAELKQMIINLADFIEKLINNYHNELSVIHYKITSLEARDLIVKLPKPKVPPPPPQYGSTDGDEVKSVILKELKDLFKEEE